MRILFLLCFVFTFCEGIYSQKQDNIKVKIYETYKDFLLDSSKNTICSIKTVANKSIFYLKIKCENDSVKTVWGLKYNNRTWVKNLNKFYELEKDSAGFYFDVFDNGDASSGLLAFGLVGALVYSSIEPSNTLDGVIIRFREDTTIKEFLPFEFPTLKPSRAIYYYTKYSKNEAPLKIVIDNKTLELKKGSYYEQILPSRVTYTKHGECLEEEKIPFQIKIKPAQTSVILFKRKKDGTLVQDELNPNMVKGFLKKKDNLVKITP